MKSLGICFGASTIQCIVLNDDSKIKSVELAKRIIHEGNPEKALLDFFSSVDLSKIDKIAVTGRSFRKNVSLSSISEAEAIEYALKEEYPSKNFADLVISCGGETQLIYKIGKSGNITSVLSGNKCASGTGEFFLQQIGRMNLSLEKATELACEGTPHKIAGRCSVFCKSDCTHALNKGVPVKDIAAGLCVMMAGKIFEIIKDIKCEKAICIGGGTQNHALLNILRERLPKVDVPKNATMFEAYGAALWALENNCGPLSSDLKSIIMSKANSYDVLEPLENAAKFVTFKQNKQEKPIDGEEYIVGLDVGSTTTKAVLMHKGKNCIAASVYLRTNGNPIEASKQCYASIREQIGEKNIKIVGLGVTGSGRQIAALHALTDCVINEIIAHATAAYYFDKDVDTIFEIGGQDAKYTYLTGGVPSDYAMNEACSAGTGSFLEESAKESMNVDTKMIGDLAIQGKNPPNFTDQCAAFISSDIKRASQEGIEKNDILAGLVYSICMNYLNRVKKSRPVGKKIFMQGGVCYNKAVPIAMASLIKTNIIVPPDPGLMGAFGIALEVKKQQELGLVKIAYVNLDELINRKAETIGSFICAGGKEKCDRKCEINKIQINDKLYPFGGACDRYYNLRLGKESDSITFDYVAIRQNLLFEKYLEKKSSQSKKIGIMRSFLTHSFAPLYTSFFSELGLEIVLSDETDPEGLSRIEAAFCLPVEISHGHFLNLIKKNIDYIFLPHILKIPTSKNMSGKACVFVQGEPYYLKTTFREEIENSNIKILSPILNMATGYEQAEKDFINLALSLGNNKKDAKAAFKNACKKQRKFEKELLEYGEKALKYLDKHPETFGIVLLGRPYNTFESEANMGIPHKVASRNVMIIPYDMLPIENHPVDKKIYWAMGQKIMKTAQLIKEKENLFGFYITNFSCGPDSFLLGYFRNLMQAKPSLTLELDQHTADAGIDTRIEAALDIMKAYRAKHEDFHDDNNFKPAYVKYGKKVSVVSSYEKEYSLNNPNVEIIFPSMGKYSTQAIATLFKGLGITSHALPIPDKDVFLEGRKNSSCKECLPYIITAGSFLSYLKKKKDPNKVTILFMASSEGPCRLGQYSKALEQIIEKNKMKNVAVFSLTDENGYAGLGNKMLIRGWKNILIADVFNDIKSMLSVTAKNKKEALQELEKIWNEEILEFIEGKCSLGLKRFLEKISLKLSKIPLKKDPSEIPLISLVGEIFVRREEFSRKNIIDYLENNGFMVKVAPVAECIYYSNYALDKRLGKKDFASGEIIKAKIMAQIQKFYETKIKSILAKSGLYKFEMIEIDKTVNSAKHLINENLEGEAVLTTGLALREILHDSCGVISIGPFGCMPSRLAEAILRKEMNITGKKRIKGCEEMYSKFEDIDTFPYLAIETDGNPYPQMIEANLEAFILQAKRVHEKIK